jgi:hypothetical protein
MFKKNSDITDLLQSKIDTLALAGGGEIIIPAGTFTFRPIQLRSHICLTLSAGARLIASTIREDYHPVGYDHNEMGPVHSALFALDQEHITIRGAGIIDLSGTSFYHMDQATEVATIGPEVSQAHLAEAPRRYTWRVNQPIFFHRCSHICFDGLTIVNAPCWTLSFNFCSVVKMHNLCIENSLVLPNNDGMHFTGSRDIIISGCQISAGDDCIAFSSITDWNVPCENIVVSDCIFQSASKAISIGYMHSIVRNIVINNVIVKKSNRAFVVMCHPRTGLVENVRVNNCVFEGRSYGGNWWGNGEAIVLMVTPHHISTYRDPQPANRFEVGISNISFSHISCRCEHTVAVVANERLIEGVRFHQMVIEVMPEEKPSLKGHVIDLAPGPVNIQVPLGPPTIFCRNAQVSLNAVTDSKGQVVGISEIA